MRGGSVWGAESSQIRLEGTDAVVRRACGSFVTSTRGHITEAVGRGDPRRMLSQTVGS